MRSARSALRIIEPAFQLATVFISVGHTVLSSLPVLLSRSPRTGTTPTTANGLRLPCRTGGTPHGPPCQNLRSGHRSILIGWTIYSDHTPPYQPRELPTGHLHLDVTPSPASALAICLADAPRSYEPAGTVPPLAMSFPCPQSHVAIGSLAQGSTLAASVPRRDARSRIRPVDGVDQM